MYIRAGKKSACVRCSWTPRSNKNSKWRWDQVLIVKFCVMLMNTWSMCIKMNILLMSVGLIVLSPLNTWCGSDVHFTLDMECDLQVVGSWATWGFFYTPWNTHRHFMPRTPKNNCVQSFGFLRDVSRCLFVCIFRKIVREREREYFLRTWVFVFKARTCVGLVFLLVLG